MKKHLTLLLVALLSLTTTGCVGVFVAGAATAVYVVTDPRSSGEILQDQNTSLDINALGNKAPFKSNVRVTASTFRGNVLLMGQAVNASYRDSLEAEVRKMKGVNLVYNQMRVKPLLTLGEVSHDTWITTKIKSAFIAEPDLRDIKISVYTEDGEVFLVGAISQQQAEKAVDVARNVSGVKKVIKAFYHGKAKQAETTKPQTQKPAPIEDISNQPASRPANKSNNEAETEVIPYIEPVEVDAL
ncbi:BON domain-containing protein [Vibrio sp. SCSIO 43137]|uniref:BON domain-containing protein n=1 Tax=Vibrio sp. SCSIO 43137 TaxID=3021011 RepID=UPI002FE41E5D